MGSVSEKSELLQRIYPLEQILTVCMSLPCELSDTGEVRNFINGEWQLPSGEDGQEIFNPGTDEQLAYSSFSSSEDIEVAVDAGRAAFDEWRNEAVESRIQPLFHLKELLEDHQDELAELLVQDHGKTFDEARGELRRGIENVEVACGIPSLMQAGTLANAAPDIDMSAIRQPVGVFTAITPFNFPGMIPLWFLPYAVATGNAFILKPSEQDPLVPLRIMELIEETNLPEGVVQLVHGGTETVNRLLEHEGVSGVSFVGSTPVARHIYETAAGQGKRVQAQGGAKNFIIVTETADLGFAAEQTVSSAYACGGERCLANDIAIVEDTIYEEFTDLVVELSRNQTVGYGLNSASDIGALISPAHKQLVEERIERALAENATLVFDGREVESHEFEDGVYLGPTVFRDVTLDMSLANEEIFGPVVGLMEAVDIEQAIRMLNKSQYGNAASLFTGSGADAQKFRQEAEVGNLGINVGTAAPMAFFHFGGEKDSFFGDLHAQGEDMIQFYTDKSIYIERWPGS